MSKKQIRSLADPSSSSSVLSRGIIESVLTAQSPADTEAWLRVGAVIQFWRNPIEAFHSVIPDPTMARLNIATFRDISQFVSLEGIVWESLRSVLMSNDRRHPDGRLVAAVFDEYWPEAKSRIGDAIRQFEVLWKDDRSNRRLLLARLVISGQRHGYFWFGSPSWPSFAHAYTHALQEDEAFHRALLKRPESLDAGTWKRLIRASYVVRAQVLREAG